MDVYTRVGDHVPVAAFGDFVRSLAGNWQDIVAWSRTVPVSRRVTRVWAVPNNGDDGRF